MIAQMHAPLALLEGVVMAKRSWRDDPISDPQREMLLRELYYRGIDDLEGAAREADIWVEGWPSDLDAFSKGQASDLISWLHGKAAQVRQRRGFRYLWEERNPAILSRYMNGESVKHLATEYEVSETTVRNIVKRGW